MTLPHQPSPHPVRIELDPWGQLVMETDDGRKFCNVVPVRAFPVSDPDRWISLCDDRGAEILCIDDIRVLPANMRATLELELSHREFVPIILKILSSTHHEPSEWEVETDRGHTTFQLNSEDDVRRISSDQASIVDAHGIRYRVPSVRRLDAGSRRILEYFL